MPSTEKKRQREKRIVAEMITLYCRDHHKQAPSAPCDDCAALITYAHQRSDKCPFMENKTFCSNCKVHCYKPDMREQIRTVMRYAGPRMLKTHPILAIRHLIESKMEKHNQQH